VLSKEQERQILNRVKETIKIFLANEGKISDEDLANILILSKIETSSSTVGRDLKGKVAKDILSEEEYKHIQNLRAANKLRGNQKGGINSSISNNYIKEENGKFTGCKRNGR